MVWTPGRLAAVAAIVCAALAPFSPAHAQPYPSRPITIVVALAAGTGMDIVVRTYAEKLSQTLGRPIIIENRPGNAGLAAVDGALKAPADGYTLLAATSSAMAIRPTMFKKPPYDPNTDFVPLSHYLKSPFVLVVNPDLPIKSVPDLIAYVKARPGKIAFSSTSIGGAPHLSGEYINQRFGVQMTHVRYKISPQAIQDVAAAMVQLTFAEAAASLALIRDGKLRASRSPRPRGSAPCPTCRRSRRRPHPRFRGGVVAHAVRPFRCAKGDRRPPAHRDDAHHRDAGIADPHDEPRPDPVCAAADREVAALHQVRDRQVGRPGEEPRPGGDHLGPGC